MPNKVLVVDDDAGIRDVLKIMLEDEGYEVATATDGAFLKTITGQLPDVILLDIWLAGINGEEICKKLKANIRTKHIPIIVISANVDTEGITRRIGADDYIQKPFAFEELANKVQFYSHKQTSIPS